jgi:transcriptional regulator with XRE-family HTH domain
MVYVIQTRSEGHILKLVTGDVSPPTQNSGSDTTVTTCTYSSRIGEILNHCLRQCQSQNAGVSKPVETLAQYVTRIMQEKNLRPKDVERRSGDEIDDAYVIKIMKGITTNPSISKTQALAQGLGVDEDDLFRVARGLPLTAKQIRGGEPWPGPVLAKAIERIVASPELTRAVKTLLSLKPSKLKAMITLIESKKE